jgi:hypothetical protein
VWVRQLLGLRCDSSHVRRDLGDGPLTVLVHSEMLFHIAIQRSIASSYSHVRRDLGDGEGVGDDLPEVVVVHVGVFDLRAEAGRAGVGRRALRRRALAMARCSNQLETSISASPPGARQPKTSTSTSPGSAMAPRSAMELLYYSLPLPAHSVPAAPNVCMR